MTKQEQIKEIKKALECCLNPELNCCNDCPYNNNGRLSCLESEMLKDALNLINELESENKELRVVTDIANERTYRKKFTDEWRKEYQKELDKQGNGHIAGHPDFDLVYKLYFEQKDRIAELEKENALIKNSVAMRDYKTLEEISNNRVKEFAEKLKNNCAYSFIFGQKFITEKRIDELLKEYEK